MARSDPFEFPKQCPVCGGVLSVGYQKREPGTHKYVAYCLNSACDGYERGEIGRGETVKEAVAALHRFSERTI